MHDITEYTVSLSVKVHTFCIKKSISEQVRVSEKERLNPVTDAYLEDDAVLEMDTIQLSGVVQL